MLHKFRGFKRASRPQTRNSHKQRSIQTGNARQDPHPHTLTEGERERGGVRFLWSGEGQTDRCVCCGGEMGSGIKPITGSQTYLRVLYWGISSESAPEKMHVSRPVPLLSCTNILRVEGKFPSGRTVCEQRLGVCVCARKWGGGR